MLCLPTWWQGSAWDWSRQVHLDSQNWAKITSSSALAARLRVSARSSETLAQRSPTSQTSLTTDGQLAELALGRQGLNPSHSGQLVRPVLQAAPEADRWMRGPPRLTALPLVMGHCTASLELLRQGQTCPLGPRFRNPGFGMLQNLKDNNFKLQYLRFSPCSAGAVESVTLMVHSLRFS